VKLTALSHEDSAGANYVVDFGNDDALVDAVNAVEGNFKHVVLAHGFLEQGPWQNVSPAKWRRMLDANLNSIYTILFAALPKMAHGGSIVIISSTGGFDHSPVGGPHYTVSKWGLNGLVRHLADELGPDGIRINSVCPGLVDNPMGHAFMTEADYNSALRDIPLRRGANPDEIAKAVMFLLSEAASFITGVNLSVSGGYK
jgi:3-oxoacyl-[acyl-carrier protein] reductase